VRCRDIARKAAVRVNLPYAVIGTRTTVSRPFSAHIRQVRTNSQRQLDRKHSESNTLARKAQAMDEN
jgi:hypothetical protein